MSRAVKRVTVPTARRALAVTLLLVGLVGAAAGAAQANAGGDHDVLRSNWRRSYVAHVVAPTSLRSAPAGRTVGWLENTTDWSHGPMDLFVLRARRAEGHLWLLVRLPDRPNAAEAWIDADRVQLRDVPWRIDLNRATRTMRVFFRGKLWTKYQTVVGAPSTPTPAGTFAIYEKQRQSNAAGFIGPWALHLTAHSDVLDNYGGGPGRVAIHGRSGASLSDPLGTARSHGCIRIDNIFIRELARHMPVGTPVTIR